MIYVPIPEEAVGVCTSYIVKCPFCNASNTIQTYECSEVGFYDKYDRRLIETECKCVKCGKYIEIIPEYELKPRAVKQEPVF